MIWKEQRSAHVTNTNEGVTVWWNGRWNEPLLPTLPTLLSFHPSLQLLSLFLSNSFFFLSLHISLKSNIPPLFHSSLEYILKLTSVVHRQRNKRDREREKGFQFLSISFSLWSSKDIREESYGHEGKVSGRNFHEEREKILGREWKNFTKREREKKTSGERNNLSSGLDLLGYENPLSTASIPDCKSYSKNVVDPIQFLLHPFCLRSFNSISSQSFSSSFIVIHSTFFHFVLRENSPLCLCLTHANSNGMTGKKKGTFRYKCRRR